ncbi:DELLA protein RGL3 [Abeliophyllum distichum]|uniref:DELLA protein RGL3 n=1 Tax=Abeliophyllum distichum TaxID=126358 RepID=A0ABD1U3N8_9LAMI
MAFQLEGSKKKDKNTTRISYLVETKKDQNPCFPQESFEILSKYQSQVKRLNAEKINEPSAPQTTNGTLTFSSNPVASAECIMKVARMRLHEDCYSYSINPFKSQSGISEENSKDMELGLTLLIAAEKFSIQQFDTAEKLLRQCVLFASPCDSPVRRVVTYFAEALREMIDKKRGRIDLERKLVDFEESLVMFRSVFLSCEQKLPLTQISQFTGMQAILDSVALARKIHLVDFRIRSGSHWIILMQDLASRKDCPVELLKITAVGTSKNRLERTGKMLSSFAESLNLPFLFKTVISELNDLKEGFFEVEAEEMVAVYLFMNLSAILAWPNHLERFMEFVKKLNPCVTVVVEMEANTNTPIFMDRFYEAIFLTSAIFDLLDACLKVDSMYRKIVEETYFREMISSTITGEGEGRIQLFAKIDYWREFFARFDLVETELSQSSLYQANLMLKTSPCWSSVTLDMNGKSLIMGSNETPILSLSVWKFKCESGTATI